ncbi:hypothetical protein GTY86_05170 [Streptomyces sp. SID5770]|uniref:hypothetical protein n=1 Tax=Streptomyces sp. SID5770 TaxID=2690308 RepID=UPI0013698EE0|nr:hypothetical protein [Streptomyces sp. SID5770]MZE50719.1 hypothetical protein [Streptomyces sp. SID5770]
MIRLPSNLAALTAPIVASSTGFPGIPIGRSLLDGRPFHLSPVMVDTATLPSTNSLALGGLGSGKSTTAKIRARRETLDNCHQCVVIDMFGEHATGEWTPITRSVGGQVIEASNFALNPCSDMLPPAVREQLLRALVAAAEPTALDSESAYALQHALSHPKATTMEGLVQALITPEEGQWPVQQVAAWGTKVAMALSRYIGSGSMAGIFDGRDTVLPPTDLPILTFDLTRLDRNSPAIPALMAAITCWTEHIWLPQSTAVHRHLILEEAWQIFLWPETAELVRRLLRNSRRAGLSLDVVMHTLSDLGEGPARDLARLCEIAHIGRLPPDEAALAGTLLDLPAWAVDEIPRLGPGQAVWKVGPHYVDIVQTLRDKEEADLTDTSTRRRAAQTAHTTQEEEPLEDMPLDGEETDVFFEEDHQNREEEEEDKVSLDDILQSEEQPEEHYGEDHQEDARRGKTRPAKVRRWKMPFNVQERTVEQPEVVTRHPDPRHELVLQAARAGRYAEAGELAAIGERQDLSTYGAVSPHALAWLETRAQVADLSGLPGRAVQYRATVARMAQQHEHEPFWQQDPTTGPAPAWHSIPGHDAAPPGGTMSGPALPAPEAPAAQPRRRWPYAVAVLALALTAASIIQATTEAKQREQRAAVAADYRGRSGAKIPLDGVQAEVVAQWSTDRTSVTVQLRSYFDKNARYLRIEADEQVASTESVNGWYPKSPKVTVPVVDPLADVTVQVAVGGRDWQAGDAAPSLTVRLSPTGVAYDGDGRRLPSDL